MFTLIILLAIHSQIVRKMHYFITIAYKHINKYVYIFTCVHIYYSRFIDFSIVTRILNFLVLSVLWFQNLSQARLRWYNSKEPLTSPRKSQQFKFQEYVVFNLLKKKKNFNIEVCIKKKHYFKILFSQKYRFISVYTHG